MLKDFMLKAYWLLPLLSAGLYLFVSIYTPLSVMVWQNYDDMLFIKLAKSIADGYWLGQFSQFTLMKGPGYPLFLAATYWSGLPVTFTHALFYCSALAAFSWVVFKLSKSYPLALSIFIISLWHPKSFEVARVVRDAIYSGQVILFLAAFLYGLFIAPTLKKRVTWGIISGIILGWIWLTREEGVWLLGGIFIMSVFAILREAETKSKTRMAIPIIAVFVAFIFVHLSFGLCNQFVYGRFLGVDVKEKNFQAALKAMESVRVGERIPYLSVPRKARLEIYSVSPRFAELRKFIDPEGGASPWEAGGCSFRPTTCGDIGNGFYLWAVRDAADKLGYFASPQIAADYFGSIAEDVTKACKDGRLTCESNIVPYMPPVTIAQIQDIPAVMLQIWNALLAPGILDDTTPWEILGPEAEFENALEFLNYPTHYPSLNRKIFNFELTGWYYNKAEGDEWFGLKIKDEVDDELAFLIRRNDSQDLVKTFKDDRASRQRFLIKGSCGLKCKLMALDSNGRSVEIPLQEIKQTTASFFSLGTGILGFEPAKISKKYTLNDDVRVKVSHKIRSAYYPLYKTLPFLVIAGMITYVLSCFFVVVKKGFSVIWVLAGACWVLILTRAIILMLVDISSFPAVTVVYMQPLYGLSVIASCLSIWIGIKFIKDLKAHDLGGNWL